MTTTTDSTRDELAALIHDAEYGRSPVAAKHWPERIHAAAGAILAAGYRKPRTIATVEELDALPDGSVVLDADGDVSRRTLGGWTTTILEDDGGWWLAENVESVELPATVLWEPEA